MAKTWEEVQALYQELLNKRGVTTLVAPERMKKASPLALRRKKASDYEWKNRQRVLKKDE